MITKSDHIFHSLEVKKIEVYFYQDHVIINDTNISKQDKYMLKDYPKDNLAKYLAHKYEMSYNGKF